MSEKSIFLATKKSNDELYYCIDNREKFLTETVEAAVSELQARGAEFSEQELRVIAEDMEARRQWVAGIPNEGRFGFNQRLLQVEDPEAPLLYSKRVIWVFSILFSVFFGSVMMAMNVYNTTNRNKAPLVVLYGLIFTIATILIAGYYQLNSSFSIFFSVFGAGVSEALFWNRLIGNSTMYRARSYQTPLIIAFAIIIPIIVLIILYSK
jgi:hypothetical protein